MLNRTEKLGWTALAIYLISITLLVIYKSLGGKGNSSEGVGIVGDIGKALFMLCILILGIGQVRSGILLSRSTNFAQVELEQEGDLHVRH